MSTAALAVAARRVAAATSSDARRLAPAAGRAIPAPQPLRAGLHTGTAARAAAGDNEPGMFERIKRMFGISKQHVAGAASNQAQAARDIGSGRASMSDELKEHGKAAKEDVKQWGHELKEAAEGKEVRSAKVRDMPPRFQGQPVKDNVSEKPLGAPAREADAGKPEASRRMGPGPMGGPGSGAGSGVSATSSGTGSGAGSGVSSTSSGSGSFKM